MSTLALSVPARPMPLRLLQLEGAILFSAATFVFHQLGGGWLFFGALLLVPDLSLLGYLANARIGAAVYNAGHSVLLPGLLAASAWITGWQTGLLLALVWVAHIGMDRAFGYGLKYSSGFHDTHLSPPA